MGGAVSAVRSAVRGFVVDVGKFIVKKGVSFVGGKIPIVGGMMADWVNGKIGGRFAKGGRLQMGYNPNGDPVMMIQNKANLLALMAKFPDLALKYGLTPDKVNNFQVKSVASQGETQRKTALEEDQGEVKEDEYAGNASINKSLALKRGGRARARSESPMKAKMGMAKKANPWMEHVKKFRMTKEGKALTKYSDVLKQAKLTYKK